MGGRGSSSASRKASFGNMSDKQLRARIDALGSTMERYASDATGYPNNVPGASKSGYLKYRAAQRGYSSLRDEQAKRLRSSVRSGGEKQQKRTFVNSYGEATTRDITSVTYERARKRMEKAVLRNMGY